MTPASLHLVWVLVYLSIHFPAVMAILALIGLLVRDLIEAIRGRA